MGELRLTRPQVAVSYPHLHSDSLIGRNGIGKSTLLRNLALREVPIPTHISVL